MKNKYLTLLLLLLLGIANSCMQKEKNLTISEDKLIQIFFDIHAAENIISRSSKETKDSLSIIYMKQIFDIHKIDKNEFEKNLNILRNNPEDFKKFYDKLSKYGTKTLKDFRKENKEAMLK